MKIIWSDLIEEAEGGWTLSSDVRAMLLQLAVHSHKVGCHRPILVCWWLRRGAHRFQRVAVDLHPFFHQHPVLHQHRLEDAAGRIPQLTVDPWNCRLAHGNLKRYFGLQRYKSSALQMHIFHKNQRDLLLAAKNLFHLHSDTGNEQFNNAYINEVGCSENVLDNWGPIAYLNKIQICMRKKNLKKFEFFF